MTQTVGVCQNLVLFLFREICSQQSRSPSKTETAISRGISCKMVYAELQRTVKLSKPQPTSLPSAFPGRAKELRAWSCS